MDKKEKALIASLLASGIALSPVPSVAAENYEEVETQIGTKSYRVYVDDYEKVIVEIRLNGKVHRYEAIVKNENPTMGYPEMVTVPYEYDKDAYTKQPVEQEFKVTTILDTPLMTITKEPTQDMIKVPIFKKEYKKKTKKDQN